jgi:deoxyribodipyrimidine photo-lyase
MTALVWYRDDLRVSDHVALHAAAKSHASVAFVYVLDDRAPGIRPLGGAARWWLAQSLRALQASLRQRGASLVLRQGSAPAVIAALAREVGAEAVYWNEIAQAPHRAVEDQVAAALNEIGIVTHRFPGDLLASPSQIRNKENRGLRVFTPFWRRVQALGDPPKPLPAPKTLKGVADLASDRLEDWKFEPTRPDWRGLRASRPQGVPGRRHCRLFR